MAPSDEKGGRGVDIVVTITMRRKRECAVDIMIALLRDSSYQLGGEHIQTVEDPRVLGSAPGCFCK